MLGAVAELISAHETGQFSYEILSQTGVQFRMESGGSRVHNGEKILDAGIVYANRFFGVSREINYSLLSVPGMNLQVGNPVKFMEKYIYTGGALTEEEKGKLRRREFDSKVIVSHPSNLRDLQALGTNGHGDVEAMKKYARQIIYVEVGRGWKPFAVNDIELQFGNKVDNYIQVVPTEFQYMQRRG